jgi:hypothetical protein
MIMKKYLGVIFLSLASTNTFALSVSGKVDMLEVWQSGNVAFTLSTAVSACNAQFILNYSSNGSKNMYSALLAAKISGNTVNVTYSDACGNAENYGGQYNVPTYLYPSGS